VLRQAAPPIHPEAGADHADDERAERSGKRTQCPPGVATNGGAYESQQFGHVVTPPYVAIELAKRTIGAGGEPLEPGLASDAEPSGWINVLSPMRTATKPPRQVLPLFSPRRSLTTMSS